MKALFAKLAGGHDTTPEDIKAIAIKQREFKVIHSGWLQKVGDIRSNWSKRFFLLVGPKTLFYFETEDKANRFRRTPCSDNESCSKLAKGSVALHDSYQAAVKGSGNYDGKSNVFTLKGKAGADREFIMSADSAESMNKWLQAFKEGEEFGKRASVPLVPGSPIVVMVGPAPVSAGPGVVMMPAPAPGPQQVVVMSPMAAAMPGPAPMVVMVPAPAPAPVVVMGPTIVDGVTVPPAFAAMTADNIRNLIAMFEAVQIMNTVQIQSILERLNELDAMGVP